MGSRNWAATGRPTWNTCVRVSPGLNWLLPPGRLLLGTARMEPTPPLLTTVVALHKRGAKAL